MSGKSRKKPLLYGILILLLLIILAALGYVLFIVLGVFKSQSVNDDVKSLATETVSTEIATDANGKELAYNPIDFDALEEQNDEIYAWITIPNTNVDYPVLQSMESDFFYLEHDINKNYLFAGSIYSEVCNLRNFSDRNTVLYGHNMLDGSMFATLHKFEDEDFFDENRYIYIYQKNRKLTYEIVSAYNYDTRHIMNSFNFDDDEVFQSYIESVMNPHSTVKNVNEDIQLDLDSKLLTLSTCLNGYDEGRYLVQGVLIKDEETN